MTMTVVMEFNSNVWKYWMCCQFGEMKEYKFNQMSFVIFFDENLWLT